MEDDYAIGLDLGTTFSCIGVYRKGGVEIIPNSKGEKITPSVVIFKDEKTILVGEDTTEFLVKNSDSCIYEVKRLLGINFDDEKYKDQLKQLPFKIIESRKTNSEGKIVVKADIEVNVKGKKQIYSPAEISSLIIKKWLKTLKIIYIKKSKNWLLLFQLILENSKKN